MTFGGNTQRHISYFTKENSSSETTYVNDPRHLLHVPIGSCLQRYAEYINAHSTGPRAQPLDRNEPYHIFRPSHSYGAVAATQTMEPTMRSQPLMDPFVSANTATVLFSPYKLQSKRGEQAGPSMICILYYTHCLQFFIWHA